MTTLIAAGIDGYNSFIIENIDPRVKPWLTMQSPIYPMLIIIAYQYFVRVLGPKFMENRKAYTLEKTMIIYNCFQILINGYFVKEVVSRVILRPDKYNVWCATVDYSYDEEAVHFAFTTYMFYLSRCSDLMDTVFMVLRKKFRQVSFLHIYHHSGMVMVGWIFTAYAPGGHVAYFGVVNAFVHCVMYFYYLLTAFKPEYKNSIWWKRHITEMQLAQFVIVTVHAGINVLNPYCTFPKLLIAPLLPQGIFIFLLFWDFYKKTYLQKKVEE
ncbi:hypothetical protein LSTR_LSTR010998 [Laodelphax striatellus]|uniref:Elongation of very long chain fatty acids protein n=1 Tax=Laodelphax striatellus TaxID=195883 RepID=A0A482X563_LAOST|nr:hypothetical protein LSTR_LSTR010998 [Laodelphax striatellus]